MSEFADFSFAAPAWLLLLPPAWVLLWYFAGHWRRRSMWRRVCDAHLLARMRVDGSAAGARGLLLWPLALVLTLSLLAAAGPGWRKLPQPLLESASARVIVLDLSLTMRVRDVSPNRYSRAAAAARHIIGADFEGETALVTYAGTAFTVAPLSRDSNTLLAFVDALEPGLLPLDGSRLDLGIERARDLLQASVSGRGQIFAITGGTAQRGRAVQAARDAREGGHQVSILAVGTAAGGPLVDDKGALERDGSGRIMLARTDFDGLRSIARAGGGVMHDISGASAFDPQLGARIGADMLLETAASTGGKAAPIANEGYWLLYLALPFALLLFRRNLLLAVLIMPLLPLPPQARAADTGSIWQHSEQQAYIAYRNGEYGRSAELARAPLLAGAAFYRAGDFAAALEHFARGDSAAAHYNRGNALVRLDRLDEAIDAYQQALRLDAGFLDARFNKRLLELYLQQRETAAAGDASGEATSAELEALQQPSGEGRVGLLGEQPENPADRQQADSGVGASQAFGQLDPFEQFDGRDQAGERFSLADGIDPAQADRLVDYWVARLPTASSELFRRKFLRDYQRQQEQTR